MLTGCGVATRWIRRICELRGPGRPYPPPGRTEEADQDGDKRHSAPLEAPWRADARQLPHEQAEVGATDAGGAAASSCWDAPPEKYAAHAPGFIEMRVGPFQALAPLPQEPLPAGPPRIRRRLAYTACWAAAFPFQFRRPRSGSET